MADELGALDKNLGRLAAASFARRGFRYRQLGELVVGTTRGDSHSPARNWFRSAANHYEDPR